MYATLWISYEICRSHGNPWISKCESTVSNESNEIYAFTQKLPDVSYKFGHKFAKASRVICEKVAGWDSSIGRALGFGLRGCGFESPSYSRSR